MENKSMFMLFCCIHAPWLADGAWEDGAVSHLWVLMLSGQSSSPGKSKVSRLWHQYMQSHCGRIPSILEWFLPSWNKSFQDGRNPSGFVPEFGYDSHPQNSSSIFVNVIWKIFFPISFYCRDILHLPWSDSLVWKESFQTGRNPSRLEWILPV